MRTATFTLIFITAFVSAFATTRTLSNDPAGGSQYNDLAAVYNASAAGDTILIEGTDIIYPFNIGCGGTWNKRLLVIGIGFNPQKQSPRRSKIGLGDCGANELLINSNASGSIFYGIEFNDVVKLAAPISSLEFKECLFINEFEANGQTVTNMAVTNCIFSKDNTNNLMIRAPGNFLITGCVFDGTIDANNVTNTVTIDHCLFLRNNNGPLHGLKNAVIKNSIFMNHINILSTVAGSGCTFLNNIARLGSTWPPAGHTGSGNINNTNPNFVTYTLGTLYNATYDFHLQSGSPAILFANDGTDCGLHGGSSKFSETGEPLIVPIIRSVNITNTSVQPNGTLNVQINATKPDDD